MVRRRTATFTRSVAPGIHRLDHAYVNCYLVEEGDSVTLVDTGLPAAHRFILDALSALGRGPGDVAAVVLTHAHFDHVGTARRLQAEIGCPVHVHPRDARLARHPYRYRHERPRSLYPFQYPKALPVLASMAAAGALRVPGVDEVRSLPAAGELDVPGRPTVVFTPGHTFGHCALHFADRDAVITGDALVTLDPYTGATGPRIVAGAATADSRVALDSLERIGRTGARVLLPGHGEPWRGDIDDAVAAALVAGPS
jgi:glyoxylase-like metal-dependent hydrolase (beta-lactamase superfamily II)